MSDGSVRSLRKNTKSNKYSRTEDFCISHNNSYLVLLYVSMKNYLTNMELHFDKYSALGNDFLVIDNRNGVVSETDYGLFKKLCERRTSVGADGVILITTEKPDFIARFFNSDGQPASMCGNGARVAVDCARRWSIISENVRFLVENIAHRAMINDDLSIGVEIHLKNTSVTSCNIEFNGKEYTGYLCDAGVPHIVFIDIDVGNGELLQFVKYVRNASQFEPDGTNVNTIHTSDKHTISIKTYERGVEDFTLACGTGAVASVYVGNQVADLELPVKVRSRGGTMLVTESESSGTLWLWGAVEKIFSGVNENI